MTTPSPHMKRLDYENVHEPKPPAPTTLLAQAAGSMLPKPLAVTLGTEPITDQQAYERFLDAQDEAHKQREAMNARAAQHARENPLRDVTRLAPRGAGFKIRESPKTDFDRMMDERWKK